MADLAERAVVSIATVSRALSGAPACPRTPTERIKELGRRPVVRGLSRRGPAGAGGHRAGRVVTPDVAHWFYAAMLDGIVTGLRAPTSTCCSTRSKEGAGARAVLRRAARPPARWTP
jgi:DNA-binding LacI/PurR family transcriptional regulator